MNIDFICRSRDIKVGTYRILVHDLAHVLADQGHSVQIHGHVESTREDSVLIYSKGDVNLHRTNDKRICGAISLSGDSNQKFDFSIVNSIEEKKSVEHLCKETAIINLVEKMYQGIPLKDHKPGDIFTVGYHGSYTHLPKLKDGFVEAFNHLIENGKSIRLNCLTNSSTISEEILKDIGLNMKNVTFRDWDFGIAREFIQQSDVGIIPNLTSLRDHSDIVNDHNNQIGTYNTDYIFRFKNKSNPGRSFVFNQLGIPVITDLTPSMMPMYFDEMCGSVATNSHTWLKAINRFMSHTERNSAALIAYNRFCELYSMEKDAQNLARIIENLRKERI